MQISNCREVIAIKKAIKCQKQCERKRALFLPIGLCAVAHNPFSAIFPRTPFIE